MCSKNQEVDPLFAQFITKDFLIQRIFRVLRNSLFRTNDLYSKKQNGARSLQGKSLLRFFAGILFEKGIVFRKNQSFF